MPQEHRVGGMVVVVAVMVVAVGMDDVVVVAEKWLESSVHKVDDTCHVTGNLANAQSGFFFLFRIPASVTSAFNES